MRFLVFIVLIGSISTDSKGCPNDSKFPLGNVPVEIKSTSCPDRQSSCPDGETCCELSSGQYGCCPIPNAVCCNDHLHCCPTGYTCDVEHSRCQKGFNNSTNAVCPDGQMSCSNDQTCCELQSGDYGCCPLPKAVCCSDYAHCCPTGYICDVEHNKCEKGISSIPWFTKKAAFPTNQKLMNEKETKLYQISLTSEIICPDSKNSCPSTSTCCMRIEGTWACCPLENAVCCSDDVHCCPSGYECDLKSMKCVHPLFGSISMLKKHSTSSFISSEVMLSNPITSLSTIRCPDKISSCPEDTTCCQLTDSSYGCCPYPQASCCSDKIHCCGEGYSCDESGSRCVRHFNSLNQTDIIPSRLKLKSIESERLIPLSIFEDQTCPDGITKCSSSSTCCPNKDKDEISYSCCPYSRGVCCGSNGSFCCPFKYICDEKQLSCQLNKTISLEENFNKCGSSDVACPSNQTCCKTSQLNDQQFACCAFPDGVCCDDGRHCCPKGTKCDHKSGGCH